MTSTDGTSAIEDITDLAEGRALIDDLDEQIHALVGERVAISRRLQALRRAEGRPGIQHARENEIVHRYVDALGDPGADIALAVLTLCRGKVG